MPLGFCPCLFVGILVRGVLPPGTVGLDLGTYIGDWVNEFVGFSLDVYIGAGVGDAVRR